MSRPERIAIGLLLAAVVAFGFVVELRSALQKHRRTDFGVYARAGWAARTGADPYAVEDDRGWHYCYPPPFAVAMVPFADPPAGEPRVGCPPFAVSVALWYLLGVACAWFAVDRFALVVMPDEPRGSRRWWYARNGPFTVALGAIGHTLARGQVNLLVVALVAAAFVELSRRRSFAAGLWLGAAACIKVIPALLALHFLMTRDRRALAGMGTALAFGLVALPAAVWGPERAYELNRQLLVAVLQPGTTGEGDRTRAVELTNATATDSQSFQAAIHNWLHPFAGNRPSDASPETRWAHWLLGGLSTAAILMVSRRLDPTPVDDLIRLGALAVAMLHLSPVSHLHYHAFALPLVCGVWLKGMSDGVAPRGVEFAALVGWGTLTTVPLFDAPFADGMRGFGAGLAASYLLLRAAFDRPRQSRMIVGWPSSSPRKRETAAALTLSAP